MDLFIIVPAQLLLFFKLPLPQGHLDVPVGILAADHESDLARWVGRDSGVGIFDRGEYFLATFLQVGDEAEVQPLVFRLRHRGVEVLANFSVFCFPKKHGPHNIGTCFHGMHWPLYGN